MLGEKLGTKILGLLRCRRHASYWVHWSSRRADTSKRKSYLQTGNSGTVIFKPAGQPPRPLLCLPRQWPVGPEPASGRPGRRGASRAPRARPPAARDAPGGLLIAAPAGSLHFQGPGSNNKAIGAPARAPLPRGAPRLPNTPRPGVPAPGARHAPALRPPRARRGATSAPRTPTALRVAFSGSQGSPASRSAPLGREAPRPCPPRASLGPGVGRNGGLAVSQRAPRLPRAPSLCAK